MKLGGAIMYKTYLYREQMLMTPKSYDIREDISISVLPQNKVKRKRFDKACNDLKKYAFKHNGKIEISISNKNIACVNLYCDSLNDDNYNEASSAMFANLLIDFDNPFIFMDKDNIWFMIIEDLCNYEKTP